MKYQALADRQPMLDVTLFDTMPFGLCIVQRSRKRLEILYRNDISETLFGRQIEIGKTLAESIPEAEIEDLSKSLKGMTPPKTKKLSLSNGKWLSLTISRDVFNEIDAYYIWAHDISEDQELTRRLEADIRAADAATQQKSNFLATISHEIRTPMQAVFGFLELIEEENPPPIIHTMVGTAKTAASGLLEILDDVLDFAKIDADAMELDVFEVPVRTLARGTLEALSVRVQGKPVKLIDEIAEDVPFVIIGDPKRLRQILMNLLGNALKFTKDGSVTLKITQNAQHINPGDKDFVLRFEIEDTGIGMSEEVRQKLFTPFTQADNSTAREFGGTGLGLSICRKLVELMGGVIGVDSVKGQGSTFWFEIPTEEVSTDKNTLDLPSLDGISVLSVEDHPAGAKEIVKSLQSMGAYVESCGSVQEALELVQRRPFDVGVIDQGLPDGLGLRLIRRIMDIRPFMGLIMYTVRDDSGLQHSLQSLGVPYLPKPASRIGLGTAVKDAANKHSHSSMKGAKRLLLAEDTASVRDVLKRQLDKLGVQADFVGNGAEAVDALKNRDYGILFTDLHMPQLDGYGLSNVIRKGELSPHVPQNFPIVVLTADVQMGSRHVYMAAGFDECLLKPVSLGQLRRLLIRWGLIEHTSQTHIAAKSSDDKAEKQSHLSEDTLPPAIDPDLLRQQMGAFDSEAIEMVRLFIEMSAELIEALKKADKAEDTKGLEETAHSLKGGAHSACCPVLGRYAADLQDAAEGGRETKGMVDKIVLEFERVKTALHDLKPE